MLLTGNKVTNIYLFKFRHHFRKLLNNALLLMLTDKIVKIRMGNIMISFDTLTKKIA